MKRGLGAFWECDHRQQSLRPGIRRPHSSSFPVYFIRILRIFDAIDPGRKESVLRQTTSASVSDIARIHTNAN